VKDAPKKNTQCHGLHPAGHSTNQGGKDGPNQITGKGGQTRVNPPAPEKRSWSHQIVERKRRGRKKKEKKDRPLNAAL